VGRVINQDIQIKQLQKKIMMEKYYELSYIIDPGMYGTEESVKQEKFISEMIGDQIIENYSPKSVPKNLIFNAYGELVYFDPLNRITTQQIKRVLFK
jgi:hypothetical protein